MTKRLFYENAYIREFKATVTGCFITADGMFEVTLDQTAFFPEEGGQTPDKGTINGLDVLDVQIKDGDIYHLLKYFVPDGLEVECRIDWDYRFSNMQMHSGEHIFSGLVHREFGFDNVGFHLSDNSATMDYNGKLSQSDVKMLERMANRAVWENRSIKTYFPTEEEIKSLSYRSKSGIEGDVRIVEIEGIDVCACCAPHVSFTSEIGLIKIVSCESYKGGVRLNYLCGKRAFEDYSRLSDSEAELQKSLNVKKGDILGSVDKLKSSVTELEYSNVSLRRMKISTLCEKSEKSILFVSGEDQDLLRFAMGELKSKFNGLCALFAGDDENGYRYIIEWDGENLSEVSEKLKNSFEVKGGGRGGSLQGSIVGTKDAIYDFFANTYPNTFE